jgi:signal transduction histidine kinase
METFFQTNHHIVASTSGQAFFIIGLLAGWEFRRYSRLTLARPLWMLAAFGLFYALAEWGRLFIPIQETYLPPAITDTLRLARVLLLAAGFAALFKFGVELLPPRSRGRLRAVPPALFAVWVGLTIGGGGALWDVELTLAIAEVQARVLLALPGGLACGLGLLVQRRYFSPLGGSSLTRWLRVAAGSAALTGLALGLMVPSIGAWPGTEWLLDAPAEVWRALVGMLFAVALARTLGVFQLEQDRTLEEAEHRAIVAQTRERIGRELSDRVAQHLYAVGLLLGPVAAQADADDAIHRALGELDVSLGGLRRFMQDSEADSRGQRAARGAPAEESVSLASRGRSAAMAGAMTASARGRGPSP